MTRMTRGSPSLFMASETAQTSAARKANEQTTTGNGTPAETVTAGDDATNSEAFI